MTISAAAVESFTFPIAHLPMSCRAGNAARPGAVPSRHCHCEMAEKKGREKREDVGVTACSAGVEPLALRASPLRCPGAYSDFRDQG